MPLEVEPVWDPSDESVKMLFGRFGKIDAIRREDRKVIVSFAAPTDEKGALSLDGRCFEGYILAVRQQQAAATTVTNALKVEETKRPTLNRGVSSSPPSRPSAITLLIKDTWMRESLPEGSTRAVEVTAEVLQKIPEVHRGKVKEGFVPLVIETKASTEVLRDKIVELFPYSTVALLEQSKLMYGERELTIGLTIADFNLLDFARLLIVKRSDQEMKDYHTQLAKFRETGQPPNDSLERYEFMLEWLKKEEAKFPNVARRESEFSGSLDLGGLVALRTMSENDVVMHIPLKLLITSEIASASAIGRQITESKIQLRSTHSILAAFMLQEKQNPQSLWYPYLRLLRVPAEYDSMPIFFNENEKAELVGSYTLPMIEDRIRQLTEEYTDIHRAVPLFRQFTLQDFIWARIVVITRVFGIVIEGNKTQAMVPLADTIRHGKANCSWSYYDSHKGFQIRASTAILEGEAISVSFGRKSNARWFVNYGFVEENNEAEDEAVIHVTPIRDNRAWSAGLQLAYSQRLNLNQDLIITMSPDDQRTDFFVYLCRILAADANERGFINKLKNRYRSSKLELASFQVLRTICQNNLERFKTTIAYDESLLADPYLLSRNVRNAVMMRVSEKRIYAAWMKTADVAIYLIQEARKWFEEHPWVCTGDEKNDSAPPRLPWGIVSMDQDDDEDIVPDDDGLDTFQALVEAQGSVVPQHRGLLQRIRRLCSMVPAEETSALFGLIDSGDVNSLQAHLLAKGVRGPRDVAPHPLSGERASIFGFAALQGNVEILSLLHEKYDFDVCEIMPGGCTPAQAVATRLASGNAPDPDELQNSLIWLIAHGASVDYKSPNVVEPDEFDTSDDFYDLAKYSVRYWANRNDAVRMAVEIGTSALEGFVAQVSDAIEAIVQVPPRQIVSYLFK